MPAKSAGTPQRPVGVRFDDAVVQPRHVLARLLRQLGVDPSRQHRIHLDVVGRPCDGRGLRELHDAALRRAVGTGERRAEDRRHRPDVHDLAAARLGHRRMHGARAEERAGEIGVDELVPLVERVVLRRLAEIGAGVVDERVDASVAFQRARDERRAIVFLRHVGGQRERLDAWIGLAQRVQRLRVLGRVAADHHDAWRCRAPVPAPCRGRCRRCRRSRSRRDRAGRKGVVMRGRFRVAEWAWIIASRPAPRSRAAQCGGARRRHRRPPASPGLGGRKHSP